MSYSNRARQLAAKAAGILTKPNPVETELVEEEPESLDSAPVVDEPKIEKFLTYAPLDRKRKVYFEEMDDEDLNRALEQARKRVERTNQSAELVRYELQLRSVEREVSRRADVEIARLKRESVKSEMDFEDSEVRSQAVEEDPDDLDLMSPMTSQKRDLQTHFPGDTPESDRLW